MQGMALEWHNDVFFTNQLHTLMHGLSLDFEVLSVVGSLCELICFDEIGDFPLLLILLIP